MEKFPTLLRSWERSWSLAGSCSRVEGNMMKIGVATRLRLVQVREVKLELREFLHDASTTQAARRNLQCA